MKTARQMLQAFDDNPIKFEEAELACFPKNQQPELIRRSAKFLASTHFGRGFRGMARRAMDAYIDAAKDLCKLPESARLLDVWEDLLLRARHDIPQKPGPLTMMGRHFKQHGTTPGAALRDAVYDWLAVDRIFLLGDLIEAAPWQPFFHALKEPGRQGFRAEIIAELNEPERTWPIIDNQAVVNPLLLQAPEPGMVINVPAAPTSVATPTEKLPLFRLPVFEPTAEPVTEPPPCCKDFPFCGCPEIPKILPVKIIEEKPRWRYKRPK